MTRQHPMLMQLDHWIARGVLTQLNRAFVRFLIELGEQNETVLWAAALVSHQLDRGEVFLDLNVLSANPTSVLGLARINVEIDHDTDMHAQFAAMTLTQWTTQISQSRLVTDGPGNTPLVLNNQRLYLRRYWVYQQTVDQAIRQRLTPIRASLPATIIDALNRFFPNSPKVQPDWQKIACVLALRARFSIITGGPGTGKTTTLTKLLALQIQLAHYEGSKTPTILLAAPTGKAAARVSESIARAIDSLGIEDAIKAVLPKSASTLHRLLGSRRNSRQFLHNRHHPIVADIVIVDEASMIDLEMMAHLVDALSEPTQLILLGDKDQLASVEAGAVLGDLCQGAERAAYDQETMAWLRQYADVNLAPTESSHDTINQQTVMLQFSHRFGEESGIGQLAKAVNVGAIQKALDILAEHQKYPDLVPKPHANFEKLLQDRTPTGANHLLKKLVLGAPTQTSARNPSYQDYLTLIQRQRPNDPADFDGWAERVLRAFDTFQVLSPLRQGLWGVEELNDRIADWLFSEDAQNIWYEGRPVMITRNDYNLGLMNGDIGITLKNNEDRLRVAFPDDDPSSQAKIRWFSPMRLPDVETAFAITVHKAQGSEFDHVALVLPDTDSPVLTRELIYTGITRAKSQFTLIESAPGVFAKALTLLTRKR